MSHAVLLGDSIFDNASYVPNGPPVIEQLRRSLPPSWQASLLAVDGDVVEDVSRQLARLPPDATHLFISVGGNDALGESAILSETVSSVAEALARLNEVRNRFRRAYQDMLRIVLAVKKPTAVCTIYDSIPDLPEEALTALSAFNEVILREAFAAGLPVIDLRMLCTHADDYSPLSPIEPSVRGGAKIARVLAEVALHHDFSRTHSVVYF